MAYALVGGWGYLGANLVKHIPSCVIARRSSVEKRPFLKKYFEGVDVRLVNEFEEDELKEALRGCKAMVYVAGKLKGTEEEMRDSHVIRAEKALKAADSLGLKKVYVSSVAAVGIAEACVKDGYVVEEEEHLKGCIPVGPYSKTKAEGERIALKYNASIIRPAAIWGEGGYYIEWKFLYFAKKHSIPIPNVSASTIPCIAKGIMEGKEGMWYYTVDATLRDLGFKAFEFKPPLWLIKVAPGFTKVSLIAMRYRYKSRHLSC